MKESLEQQISALPDLTNRELAERHHRLYGKLPPTRLPREYLELAIACHLQKQLNVHHQNKMMQAVAAAEAIIEVLITNSRHTEFFKEWRGRLHRVVLVDHGVIYNDQHYQSLSTVAQRITGKRCDGIKFFGVNPSKIIKGANHGAGVP